jgi:hypothetical protein
MNRIRAFLLLSSGVVVAAWIGATTACGGSSDDNASANAQKEQDREKARSYYVERVHNGIASCVGCHNGTSGPRFMAAEPDASYEALQRTVGLIAAPKNSPLVQYVHKDPAIAVTPDQRSLLTQWLSLEATARSLEGAVEKPKTVTDAYKQFADCMNFDVWTYYRMGDLAFTQTDSEGPCSGCHSTGQGSAWLSAAPRETFEKARQFPFIQKLIVGKLDGVGSFESLQPSKRFQAKAEEICPPESTSCHPRFGLPPKIIDSIDGFVDTTLQNLATGTCANGIVVPAIDAGPKDAGEGGLQ